MATPLEIDPPGDVGDDESPKLKSVGDVQREMARVYRAARKGRITTAEGNGLTQMLQYLGKATEMSLGNELEQRVEELEKQLAAH